MNKNRAYALQPIVSVPGTKSSLLSASTKRFRVGVMNIARAVVAMAETPIVSVNVSAAQPMKKPNSSCCHLGVKRDTFSTAYT